MKEVMTGNTCDRTRTLHTLPGTILLYFASAEKEVCKRFVVHSTTVGPAPDMHVRTDLSDVLARCRTGARQVPARTSGQKSRKIQH